MEIKDRIKQIMDEQHMTQQAFANYTGIGVATLSSIFNGRTRPTLNIVEAMKQKFPKLNTDWLLWGTGDMFIAAPAASEPAKADNERQAAAPSTQEATLDFGLPEVSPTPQQYHVQQNKQILANVKKQETAPPYSNNVVVESHTRHVTEIRVYYDDHTFETFVPSASK